MERRKRILCFGDSNTYGYDPCSESGVYPDEVKWTGRLERLLGDGWRLIPEGLNGRTTAFEHPSAEWKNGSMYLPPCLASHVPLDCVFIMLGTNDCNNEYGLSAEEIAAGMEKLILTVRSVAAEEQGFIPKIIVAAPAAIAPHTEGTRFYPSVDENSARKSLELVPLYRALAEKYGCVFFDASGLEVSSIDHEHLTETAHAELAERLYALISELFGSET